MGYWKGSGMALALDMAAALMANGMSGTDMDIQAKGSCTNCCQIFIAYDPYLFGSKDEIQDMLNRRIDAVKKAHPEREGGSVSYPGERTLAVREESMKKGIHVDEAIWKQLCSLASGDMSMTDIASK